MVTQAIDTLERDWLIAQLGVSAVGKTINDLRYDFYTRGSRNTWLSVYNYGAKGDGVTDDTAAITAAVADALLTGNDVYFPPGNYVSGAISIPSSVSLHGTAGTTIILKAGATAWLNIVGSQGAEIALSVAVSSGATAFTTTTAHGFAVDDLVKIVSQRDAVGADADAHWRLGFNTPTASTCYFGEFLRVATTPTGTTFTSDSGLLYPTYRPDNTLEVNTAGTSARATTTFAKVTPVKNVQISNFRVEGAPGAGNALINVKYGFNVFIKDVDFDATGDCYFIVFESCYRCEAKNCSVWYNDLQTDPAKHHLRNSYKTHSCQNTGFDSCFGERATQCFDLTYGGDTPRIPSTYCYIRNCETKGAISNGATTHGGTYGSQIIDNRFLDCRSNGVSNRSRNAVIMGNLITGSRVSSSYGLNLYEGWARNCVIVGNQINGFELGFAIQDGVEDGEAFQWVGLTFTNNVITQFGLYGISVSRNGNNKYIGETGINLAENVIVGCYGAAGSPKGIILRSYVCFARVENNTIDGTNAITAGIHVSPNGSGHRISNNVIQNSTSRGVWFEAVSDAVVWPTGCVHDLGNGNRIINAASGRYFIGASVTFRTKFGQGGTGGEGTTAITLTGSRGGNAAVASIATLLAAEGLAIDSTTA